MSFLSSEDVGEVAIGLNDMVREGFFMWTDGSTVDFLDWGKNQPDQQPGNGDMVRIESDKNKMGWFDASTKKRSSFLCASDVCPPGEMQMVSTCTIKHE